MAKSVAIIVAGALWAASVTGGFALAARYDATAGRASSAKSRWPADAPLALDPARPTLLLFAHPRCPCTAATIESLNRLLAHCAGRASVTVLFYDDPALGKGWAHSSLWDAAAAIDGVTVRADPLGATARLFGAWTSGQAFLFAPDGALRCEGGLTPARGHPDEGGAMRDWLLDGHGPARAPVFGCSLFSSGSGAP
ncbi:MAG TPA: RedB protein [Planctomycetota bacterium]|nr:RedB protein [Planctomycetota bacterium]